MKLIYEQHFSTMTLALFRAFVPFLLSAASLDLDRSGSKVSARGAAGTSEFTWMINLHLPNLSPFNFAVVLTFDGKLSIYCACSPFDAPRSDPASGACAGTSSSPENSATHERQRENFAAQYEPKDNRRVSRQQWHYLGADPTSSAQPCGCDPAADHCCDRHTQMLTDAQLTGCLACGKPPYDCECDK